MKALGDLKSKDHFLYGGVEWVKLETIWTGELVIAAQPVFGRAFDTKNRNDWRSSSLRRELNGSFLEQLIAAGADPEAFRTWTSDLTADDGMTDYGTAEDRIFLISGDLYRRYRTVISKIDHWWWTLTPWTCDPEYSYGVRYVNSSGALSIYNACNGSGGVRPMCYLCSDTKVSDQNEAEAARDDVMNALAAYPADVQRAAIGEVTTVLLSRKD